MLSFLMQELQQATPHWGNGTVSFAAACNVTFVTQCGSDTP